MFFLTSLEVFLPRLNLFGITVFDPRKTLLPAS